MNKERPDFETIVCGIPCGVVIDSFIDIPSYKGSPHNCDSDLDYYGYTDIEWHLIDRKGYMASWLERKMDKREIADLETEIIEFKMSEVD